MPARKKPMDIDRLERAVKLARRDHERRMRGFRQQALRLFPWICARCGREFIHDSLRELTVHHKDHDHDNNPTDGSNWELLCLYCHDREHDHLLSDGEGERPQGSAPEQTTRYRPFEGLEALLKGKK
ncbi:MAG TPA: YajD family HNH nuclease [Gammaproteobacteria bacterium]|nr:YajD family HNH nuclease [Gammaproteobacteria bacterium]